MYIYIYSIYIHSMDIKVKKEEMQFVGDTVQVYVVGTIKMMEWNACVGLGSDMYTYAII